jgi:hypothetical protein
MALHATSPMSNVRAAPAEARKSAPAFASGPAADVVEVTHAAEGG